MQTAGKSSDRRLRTPYAEAPRIRTYAYALSANAICDANPRVYVHYGALRRAPGILPLV
jgi:hypothetical protein